MEQAGRSRHEASHGGEAVHSGGRELAHVVHAAERLGIDGRGLDRVEVAALRLLLALRRPLGIEALAARLGVDLATYRDVHEPWLERSGLVERTERGRVATEKARALYGGKATAAAGAAVMV